MQPLRWVGFVSLLLYLVLHQLFLNPWVELLGYNLVGLAALITVVAAPHISDPFAKSFTATAIAMWTTGSLLASSTSFISLGSLAKNISNTIKKVLSP